MDKKVKVALLGGASVLVLGTGIFSGVRHFQKGTIPVYSMEELAQEVWGNMSSLEGSISSNVSQQVRLLDKQIVAKVHVKEGQEVKEGDPLLSYDMTLANIDLEMEKLNKQQLEVKKKGLEHDLKNLKNGKWVATAAAEGYHLDFLSATNPMEVAPPAEAPKEPEPKTQEGAQPTPEVIPPTPEEVPPTPEVIPPTPEVIPPTPEVTPPAPENILDTDGTVYSRLYWNLDVEDPNPPAPEDGVVVKIARPYKQEGNTLYFLCKKDVWLQGAFLNHIAGFRNGVNKEVAAFRCVLEQHIEDDAKEPLLSQVVIDGDKIQEPFKPTNWYRSKLGLSQWEEVPVTTPGVEEPDEEIFVPTPESSIIGGYSPEDRKKAIGEKEREIVAADLDIRGAEIKIKKTEQKLKDETVRSTVNGIVKKVGDPAKGEVNGEPFIVVESSGGVYVKGYVGEDMLGKVKPGQMITGMAYESMMPFEAEVKEVSSYPADNYSMFSNREVTYYPFTAFIKDSTGLKDREMVSIDVPQEDGAITGLFLSKEYVRTKDGEDYVLKLGKHGKLEKQKVRTGRTFYGSLIEIKEGITKEDHLAFPYGKKVKEGAKTKKASLAELYQYY